MKSNQRFIFVIGGIFSGIGKGLVAASLGKLFKENNNTVIIQKNDSYLNIDPGFLNPNEHGEVFVTNDGLETDLDLGHYERFLNQNLTRQSLITGGQIYSELLKKERLGKFLGKTIDFYQVVAEIKDRYEKLFIDNPTTDIFIIELGGTVTNNDIRVFLTAAKQMQRKYGVQKVAFTYLTYITFLSHVEEFKTKAAQHSIQELREHAIEPDFVFARCDRIIPDEIMAKFQKLTFLDSNQTVQIPDQNIYLIPKTIKASGLFNSLCKRLNLKDHQNPDSWLTITKNFEIAKTNQPIKIAIVNKYPNFRQSYLSLYHALLIACNYHKIAFVYDEINPLELTVANVSQRLNGYDGILIPGGFGKRGTEGKMIAIEYARKNKIPLLGICLGFQLVLIELARNVLKKMNANSTEFDPKTAFPIIDWFDPNMKNINIGVQKISLTPNTLTAKIFQSSTVFGRFRNRFQYNNLFETDFIKNNLVFSGRDDQNIPVILELKNHPFFVAVQFHPEWTSWPLNPNPLFLTFINKCLNHQK